MNAGPQRILVILPNNLGDVIMATPLLEGLKRRNPDARIVFFVEDGFEGGLKGNPFCDQIFRFPRKRVRDVLRARPWQKGIELLREQVDDLNRRRYDRIVNLSQHEYVSFIVSLLNAGEISGRRYIREGNHALPDPWSQYLYAVPFARRFNRLHAVDVYRRIAGLEKYPAGYTIVLDDDERARAASWLKTAGCDLSDKRLLVFQPGAAYPSKRWPLECFIRLGRRALDDGWRILVSGAPAERSYAVALAETLGKGAFCSAAEMTFRQAVALLAHARACVTPDTAMMHAAAALGVKTFALFGATNPVETGPYGEGHWVFSSSCAEKPCFHTNCDSMECMKGIPPETVYACLKDERPPEPAGCDIYRTRFNGSGDYALEPCTTGTSGYFDESGATMTLRAFSDVPEEDDEKEDVPDAHGEESSACLSIIDKMKGHLDRYRQTKRAEEIRAFEKTKESFDSFGGIGLFWAALCNIGLNSVPLFDISGGIVESRLVCDELCRRIRRTIPKNHQ